MTDISKARRGLFNRLYTYLNRFNKENCIGMNVIYVMSMIIYGNDKHQAYIKEVLNIG